MIFGYSINLLVMQAILGLSLGAIYVLMASGLSIIYSLLDIVNFAHGAFYMLGAYGIYFFLNYIGNFYIALLLSIVIVTIIGMITEIYLLKPLYSRGDPLHPLLLTFGLSLVFPDIIKIFFGLIGKNVNFPDQMIGAIYWKSLVIPKYQLFIILISIASISFVAILLKKTNIGMILRASTRDSLMVKLLGINVSRMWTLGFMVGTAFAALAGGMMAPLVSAIPDMGVSIILPCFVVVVVGGLGSLEGAIISGIIIGETVSFVSLFAGAYSDVVIFVIMAIVLIIRPRGLLGQIGRKG